MYAQPVRFTSIYKQLCLRMQILLTIKCTIAQGLKYVLNSKTKLRKKVCYLRDFTIQLHLHNLILVVVKIIDIYLLLFLAKFLDQTLQLLKKRFKFT